MNIIRKIALAVFLLTLLLTSCLMVEKADDTRFDKEYFGMHIHNAAKILSGDTTYDTPWPDQQFGVLRLWDSHVTWPLLEPEKGKWDFSKLDVLVEMADKNDVTVLHVLGLTPAWAARPPKFLAPYSNSNICASPPLLVEDWQNYVRTLAERYKGRITHWELWNEVDVWPFFAGTVPDMVTLAREAHRILKEVDPDNQVLAPSLFNWQGLCNPGWLNAFLKAGGSYYIDGFSFHSYTGFIYHPERITGIIKHIRNIAEKHDLSHLPIWNTEGSYHFADVDEAEAISFMVRMIIIQKYAGIETFCWYAWDNNIKMGGMVEPDRITKTFIGHAYARMYDWLLDAEILSLDQVENGVYVCQIRHDGVFSYITWKPLGSGEFFIPDMVGDAVRFDGSILNIAGLESVKIDKMPVLFTTE